MIYLNLFGLSDISVVMMDVNPRMILKLKHDIKFKLSNYWLTFLFIGIHTYIYNIIV